MKAKIKKHCHQRPSFSTCKNMPFWKLEIFLTRLPWQNFNEICSSVPPKVPLTPANMLKVLGTLVVLIAFNSHPIRSLGIALAETRHVAKSDNFAMYLLALCKIPFPEGPPLLLLRPNSVLESRPVEPGRQHDV